MDAAAYIRILRRRWWALVICVLAGLVGGYAVGHTQQREFQATSRSYVSVPVASNSVFDQLSGAQLSSAYVATYVKIATSGAVIQTVVTELHLPSNSGIQLSASTEAGTYLIDITATDPVPQRAAAFANAAATALHDISATLNGSKQPVTTQVIDEASVPSVAISPRPTRDLLFGLLLGIVVGFGLVVLTEVLDRTVKTGQEASSLSGAPLVGMLPRRRGGVAAATQDSPHDISSEAYRALRTAVRFLDPDQPIRTLLVTSPTPGDGKTTVAGNLAIALARGGERVIVVDCDLRRAGLGRFFGLESAVGLTSLLRRQVRLRDALQTWAPGLRVLPAGELPPNPAELLGSQAMAHLIDQLAIEADVVILDAPPVLPVTDAVVLATQVDGVLVVTRHGKTLRSSAQETARRLNAVGARVAASVLNSMPASEAREYYVEYVYQEGPAPTRSRPSPRRPDQAQAGGVGEREHVGSVEP